MAHGPVKLDFLASSVVLSDPGRLDRHKPGEHLFGVYGAIGRVLPGMTIEPFLLFKRNLQVVCPSFETRRWMRFGTDDTSRLCSTVSLSSSKSRSSWTFILDCK